jgi:hypothetical protein
MKKLEPEEAKRRNALCRKKYHAKYFQENKEKLRIYQRERLRKIREAKEGHAEPKVEEVALPIPLCMHCGK